MNDDIYLMKEGMNEMMKVGRRRRLVANSRSTSNDPGDRDLD
jgi:hypothetical protein